jgi:cytohesin
VSTYSTISTHAHTHTVTLHQLDNMTVTTGSALWVAIDEKNINGVIDAVNDSNPNHPMDPFGEAPMHRASTRLFAEAIYVLLKNGAVIDLRDSLGRTPLHCVKVGDEDSKQIASLLFLNGADMTATDNCGRTALHTSAFRKEYEMKCLSDMQNLIDLGCDIEARDTDGNTPLQLTAQRGFQPLAEKLLLNGADPDTRDNAGNTPLFLRIENTELDTGYVEVLLEGEGSVNVVNNVGDTPLHCACAQHRPVKGWVLALVNAGADVNAQNAEGDTPLHKASQVRWTEITTLLLQNGADTTLKNLAGFTPIDQPAVAMAPKYIMVEEALRRDKCLAFACARHGMASETLKEVLEEAELSRE